MHTRGAATPTAPNRAFRGTNQTQTPGLQGLGRNSRALGSRSRESLPPFLLRRAGARGPGRWHTAVLRPAATASMVSSSREDTRYLGTRCTAEDGVVRGGPPQASWGSLGTPSPGAAATGIRLRGLPSAHGERGLGRPPDGQVGHEGRRSAPGP